VAEDGARPSPRPTSRREKHKASSPNDAAGGATSVPKDHKATPANNTLAPPNLPHPASHSARLFESAKSKQTNIHHVAFLCSETHIGTPQKRQRNGTSIDQHWNATKTQRNETSIDQHIVTVGQEEKLQQPQIDVTWIVHSEAISANKTLCQLPICSAESYHFTTDSHNLRKASLPNPMPDNPVPFAKLAFCANGRHLSLYTAAEQSLKLDTNFQQKLAYSLLQHIHNTTRYKGATDNTRG
jgi:hypothetical protein